MVWHSSIWSERVARSVRILESAPPVEVEAWLLPLLLWSDFIILSFFSLFLKQNDALFRQSLSLSLSRARCRSFFF